MTKRIIYAALAAILLTACATNNYSRRPKHRKKSCKIEQPQTVEQQTIGAYIA
ncbi:MAG: entry exclusion lipoprotein TrbK [Bacteroidales bacterium]|nr:entry exclusion lipoprotein TrbK [Bacteroidales bacterium]